MVQPGTSYPRPAPFTWTPHPTRVLLPIYPPPDPLEPPALPSPPRQPLFDAPYTLSTHLFPAAYLRTTPNVPLPLLPPEGASKEERRKRFVEIREELLEIRGPLARVGYPQVLWNCANRYVRKGLGAETRSGKGVTLFFAHANGFPKETWEPTLGHLLSSPAGEIIDEVWTWESIQHGDAALVNRDNLCGVFDWSDNTRDILNFLFHYLPAQACDVSLPSHLQRVPAHESDERRRTGFQHRTFVAVGHSYGGCSTALATITYPHLVSSLILIDPVIVKPLDYRKNDHTRHRQLTLGALSRRDTWDSQEEALAQMRKSPFFGAWDPTVLQLYVFCGTYLASVGQDNGSEEPKKPEVARLKMSGIQEAVVFSETHTELEVFHLLPHLPERVALHWIMPGKPGTPEFGPLGSAQERVWVRPANASNVRIGKAGHLIPQEAPLELANELRDFLLRKYSNSRASVNARL